LLESGVPPNAPAVQNAAALVRARAATVQEHATYELSLAVLFLDRLGDPRDHQLIQVLALRLIAGQDGAGGWAYRCPNFPGVDQQQQLLNRLRQQQPMQPPGLPLTQTAAARPQGLRPGAGLVGPVAPGARMPLGAHALWRLPVVSAHPGSL